MSKVKNLAFWAAILAAPFALVSTAFAAPPKADYGQLCGRKTFTPLTLETRIVEVEEEETGIRSGGVGGFYDILIDPLSSLRDKERALIALRDLAKRSDRTGANAHTALALYEQRANKTPEGRKTAIYHYEQAILRGGNQETNLARLYQSSIGGQPDLEAARRYYALASAKGDIRSWLGLARLADDAGDDAQATELRERAKSIAIRKASEGKCTDLRFIAEAYDEGIAAEEDILEAIEWYAAAAEGGDVASARRLSRFCRSAPWSALDTCKTRGPNGWMEIAAEQGSVASMRNLGLNLIRETGDAYERGLFWLEQAVYHGGTQTAGNLVKIYLQIGEDDATQEKGRFFLDLALEDPGVSPDTLIKAAEVYRFGLGGPKDLNRAIGLYERALDQKSGAAALGLAEHYYEERPHTRENLIKAARYFREASAYGSSPATAAMANLSQCYAGTEYEEIFPDAKTWLSRARATEDIDYQLEDARRALARGDNDAYLEIVRGLAIARKPDAILELVRLYQEGALVGPQPELSDLWIGILRDPTIHYAKIRVALAEAHAEGEVVRYSPDDAYDLFQASLTEDRKTAFIPFAEFLLDGPVDYRNSSRGVQLLKDAAKDGSVRAAYIIYEYLEDQNVDYRQAVTDLDWDALLTGPDRQKVLMKMVDNATTEEDRAQALAELEGIFPCTSKNAIRLAKLYLNELEDREKAAKWLAHTEKFFVQPPTVLYDLAVVHRGLGNMAQAEEYLQRAAFHGYYKAVDELAIADFENGGRSPETIEQLLASVRRVGLKSRSADAIIGLVVDPATDPELKSRLSAVLVENVKTTNDPQVFRSIADTYLKQETQTAQERGLYYLRQAALLGDAESMMSLSRMYAVGHLVDQSEEESTIWLKRAAERGDREAMLKLSIAYQQGYGVPVDAVEAASWRERADSLSEVE